MGIGRSVTFFIIKPVPFVTRERREIGEAKEFELGRD